MRAFEIALFIVMVTAGFTIVAALHVFPVDVIPVDTSMFESYTVESLSNFSTNPGILDYFFLMVILIVDAIKWALNIILSIVIFYPYLMIVLGIPAPLTIALNAGVWFVVVIALVQIWRWGSIDIMR